MASRVDVSAFELSTTATEILPPSAHRRTVWIHNGGGVQIFIGPSDVTAATGLPVLAGEKIPIYWGDGDQSVGESIYAILASGSQTSPDDTRVFATYAL